MKRIISLILAVLMILSLVACGKNMEPSWQEQYDLGVRYLSKGNYEEAIIAFEAAIEIEPKREEAYVGLADAYIGIGDYEKAKEVLKDALVEVDSPASIEEKLLELEEMILEDSPQIGNDEYYLQVEEDGVSASAEFLDVQVHDSRTATITVSGVLMQSDYLTNQSTSAENMAEYHWCVEMYGDQDPYSVSTSWWAFDPGFEEIMTVTDMQHSLWWYDGDSWPCIGDAMMDYAEESISWTFTVPEDYLFDFAKINRYEVKITDISQGIYLTRTYTLDR